jgi:Pyruvate/2-oxoacid:ferredoxin oxidoreductase delta subunit
MNYEKPKEIRYRCSWCQCVTDEQSIILDKEEQDKFKNIILPSAYCEGCYEIIKEENEI